jgi:hypothetical protein
MGVHRRLWEYIKGDDAVVTESAEQVSKGTRANPLYHLRNIDMLIKTLDWLKFTYVV